MVSKRISRAARKLMSENPGLRYQQALNQLRTENPGSPRDNGWLTALGIADLNTWDPRTVWDANEWDSHFNFPLGFTGLPDERTNDVVTLDLGESSVGGAGPHGVIQGMTGSGISTLLRALVLGACARYSPSKLNFVLMDFRGSHTFRDFDKLPHVLADFPSMYQRGDAVDRIIEIITAEIVRRNALMDQYEVDDIVEYRAKRAAAPGQYPPLPELMVLVDEVREFVRVHPVLAPFLVRLARVGRALGIHLILCGQAIDPYQLSEMLHHWTFGISLAVRSPSSSSSVLGVGDAVRLPIGRGAALLRTDPDDTLVGFTSFDTMSPISTASGRIVPRDVVLRRLASRTVDDCGDRTLADALADVPACPEDDAGDREDATRTA